MKSALLLDQGVNVANIPDAWRDKVKPVFRDGAIVDWVIPKGFVFDGDEALLRVRTGQAHPIDDECAKACGMTPAQLSANQRQYLAAEAGIKGKKDFELFMAGVIDGYEAGTTDENPIYKPGPNKAAFDAIKKASKKEKVAI